MTSSERVGPIYDARRMGGTQAMRQIGHLFAAMQSVPAAPSWFMESPKSVRLLRIKRRKRRTP